MQRLQLRGQRRAARADRAGRDGCCPSASCGRSWLYDAAKAARSGVAGCARLAGRRTRGLRFQRAMHPLVRAVLIRRGRLDQVGINAQPNPPDRQPRQAPQRRRRKGLAIVAANRARQAVLVKGAPKDRHGSRRRGRAQAETAHQKAAQGDHTPSADNTAGHHRSRNCPLKSVVQTSFGTRHRALAIARMPTGRRRRARRPPARAFQDIIGRADGGQRPRWLSFPQARPRSFCRPSSGSACRSATIAFTTRGGGGLRTVASAATTARRSPAAPVGLVPRDQLCTRSCD